MYCRPGLQSTSCLRSRLVSGTIGIALGTLFLGACARQPAKPAFERIAILNFENLSADNSADWMGRAFAEVLTSELEGVPATYAIPVVRLHSMDRVFGIQTASAPGISSERTQAMATGPQKIGYGEYSLRAGRLEARLTVEEVSTGKMKVFSATASGDDVLGAGTALARQISSRIAPYGTRNPQALRAYITATETKELATAEVALNLAMTADPDFGPPKSRSIWP